MAYEGLDNNKNAEKWTLEEAEKLFNSAYELSKGNKYDFIGEIAKELDTYREIFTYLKDKFSELSGTHKSIMSNLEANCFSHGKMGKINTAMAIVNLKSNYKWTDRSDLTSGDKPIDNKPPTIVFIDTDNED
ncbi:hypothetical protein Harreka1_73 [Olleya phage Harreka_1]|uniref:Uncharacterized protein n=1 Tax=Olleya phage Harreka_1 TaxID=2745673 RepID=A0A8E4ZES0_9CAUD|nr:hypothetical protein M1M26_gp73 [Olleya phage Harreka_1]QQV90480.1 hypothetical protein Harreka1_73 [Olleya phage Harreka_1]